MIFWAHFAGHYICIIFLWHQESIHYPIESMCGIFTYIYHKNQSNVGKYTSLIFMVSNVGKYTSPMDPMGIVGKSLKHYYRFAYLVPNDTEVWCGPQCGIRRGLVRHEGHNLMENGCVFSIANRRETDLVNGQPLNCWGLHTWIFLLCVTCVPTFTQNNLP